MPKPRTPDPSTETSPLTPLTHPAERPAGPRLSGRQTVLTVLIALLLFLASNLGIFLVVSFVVFVGLGGIGVAAGDDLFTLSILCAIPPAVIGSSLLAGRRLAPIFRR
ncbi:MAG: hypothetical protein ACKOC5_05315 [Chloroflexota bacterium]